MNNIQKALLLISMGALFFMPETFAQVLEIEEPKQKFGFARQGEIVSLKYAYKNTGEAPLILSEYKVECTCTKAVLPETPLLPGKSDTLVVTFDTNGKMDRQERTVRLISNAKNNPSDIVFKGVVLKAKKEN